MDHLLDNAPCGYITFTDGGEIRWANSTLLKWLGYEAHEVKGQSVEMIFTLATRIFL